MLNIFGLWTRARSCHANRRSLAMKYSIMILAVFIAGCVSTSQIKYVQLDDCNPSALEIKIPKLSIKHAAFRDAIDTIYKLWLKQNSDKPTPQIIVIGLNTIEAFESKDIFTGEPLSNFNDITLVIENLSVIRCIEEVCRISGWKYKIVQGNIILFPPALVITEPWETRLYSLSPRQIDFLKISEKSSSEELKELLVKYGIKMPASIGAKATWESGAGCLIVFTLNEEHKKLEQLLTCISLLKK